METGRLHNNLPKNRYSIKTCHIRVCFSYVCFKLLLYKCTRATDCIIGTTLSLLFVIVLFLFSLLTLNESSFKWCETIGMGFSHFECNTSSSSLVLVLNKHSYWLNGDHYTQKREMVILNKL